MSSIDGVLNVNLELLPAQERMRLATSRDVAYVGGWGSGKTEDIAIETLIQCLRYPGNFGCVGSATYPQLIRSTIRKMFEFFRKVGLVEGRHWTYNKKEQTVKLFNGSEFFFQALATVEPSQLLGSEIGFLILDECEAIPVEQVDTMLSRVRKTNSSRIRRYYGNPVPEGHWLSVRFYEKPRPNHILVQAPTRENYFLPKDYIEDLEAMYPPGSVGRRRYLEGELGVPLEGAIYPEFNPQIHIIDEEPDLIGYVNAIDFGFNNPFCHLVAGITSDDDIIIIREHYARRLRLVEHATAILENYRGGATFADHDAQDREELLHLNVRTLPAMKSVIVGLDCVSKRLALGTLKILKGQCPNLIREFGSYIWNKEKEMPVKQNDHAMDALRYIVTGWDMICADNADAMASAFSMAKAYQL